MSREDRFERLVAALHEAALDEAVWPEAAGLIDEVVGTGGNALAVGRGSSQLDSEILLVRLCFGGERDEAWERRYMRDYWLRDESIPRLAALPAGKLVHTMDLYTGRERRFSRAYNEALAETGMRNGLNVRLEGPAGASIYLKLGDSTTERGRWSPGQIETIERLLPHLRRFVDGRQVLARAGALGRSLSEVLDNSRFGVIQLDRHGRIVAANDRARRLLLQRDGLVDSGGFLRARRADDRSFQRVLARALPPFGRRGTAGSMTIGRARASTRLLVHAMPVAERRPGLGTMAVAALVLVVDPERKARLDPALVGASLGLTPAESGVAVMLAAGHTVAAIAAVTRRSQGTVRWHIKRIFQKLGISQRAELVRLVLSLDGFPAARTARRKKR